MKNLLFTLALLISFGGYAQEVLLNDYAKNESGDYDKSNKYEQLHFSTYTKQNEGKAFEGILIKEKKGYSSSSRPYISIPIEHIAEFQIFLKNGRDKFLKWENTRVENNIDNMSKTIALFPHKLLVSGDDYGYFSKTSDVKLDFDSSGGTSKMILSVYINNGVRSDSMYLYMIDTSEDWKDLAFLRFINDLTVEKVQAEIDKINSSGDLFN